MSEVFCYAGRRSDEFCLHIERHPQQIAPARRRTTVPIPGRNGALHIDEGSYDNVTMQYECYFHDGSWTERSMPELAHQIKSWLLSDGGYQVLSDEYDPDLYHRAIFAGPMDIANILNRYGRCTVKFDCDPRSFLKSGEMPVRLEGTYQTVELYNPTAFASQPLITVYNSFAVAVAGELTINGITVRINTFDDQVTLDCERMDAYRQVADGAPENWNSKIYAPVFPELASGVNTISWTGGIGAVEIIPRWWTL